MGHGTVADLDESRARARAVVSDEVLRVALDLDGSLESLGNSMIELATALEDTGRCRLVRFHSASRPDPESARLMLRPLWAPWWRYGLGPAVDRLLAPVDVVHVAGLATPPTKAVPLVVSVDDLRPLRGETKRYVRISQLRRAVGSGAVLVASTRRASREVQEVLGVDSSRVAVVPPAVPTIAEVVDGGDVVVNVTGLVEPLIRLLPDLDRFARARAARVVVIASASLIQRVKSLGLNVTTRTRREAREALRDARVVLHLSDGARFPSFAIAALSAGVPTLARATSINRELLSGAAVLVDDDGEVLAALEDLWGNEPRRALLTAAGRDRAGDFAPAVAANAYVALYRDVARDFR
ncbi:MAG: glycosyltransferase [Acidobacteriota bacterium]|nr:glycosyltransferase [Acidobacteriota bacterium]